ncbi:MAG: peptidoglycan editing factor PgeF [Paludibacteraceae bacterium]|nr:peptidoglycan editing factor PgeF [Paludibacteraceae bacterium]
MPIRLEQCDLFGRQENLRHFFTTVEGGCSNGNYSTFNLGAYCGDLPENVKANRKILCQELNISPERLIVPREIHKDGIFLIDESFFEKNEEERIQTLLESDALITRMKGVCLGVTTADCVPVLLYAPKTKIVAAVHAGWRGIACEIIAKTVVLFEQMGAQCEELIACTGPCISVEAYQVGEELINGFSKVFSSEEMALICIKSQEDFHANLRLAAHIQLKNANISEENIYIHPGCTFSDKRYFSARRQTIQSGRLLSGIMMV